MKVNSQEFYDISKNELKSIYCRIRDFFEAERTRETLGLDKLNAKERMQEAFLQIAICIDNLQNLEFIPTKKSRTQRTSRQKRTKNEK